ARRIEARMRAHSCGSSSRGVAGRASTVTAFFPVHSTLAPRCVRRAAIVSTSRMRGTLSSRQGPSASSVAARMGRAAFLLPAGRIVPWSGRPPETQNVDAMGCGKLRRGLRRRQALANVRGLLPLLALALLAVAGLAPPRVHWPRLAPRLRRDAALAPGLPLVLVGLVLGPGIGLLDRAAVRALTPVTALAVGCLGAALGARLEWRLVKRVPRGVWLLCGAQALAVLTAIAASAWAITRAVPALRSAWTPILPLGLTLGAVAVVSGPVAVARAAQATGAPRGTARAFDLAATLDAIFGVLAFAVIIGVSRPRDATTGLFLMMGALLVLPTPWILPAALGLAALRVAVRWAVVRYGRDPLKAVRLPAQLGLATTAQGGTALAIAMSFFLIYPDAGALVATVVVGVLLAQLAAAPLLAKSLGVPTLTAPQPAAELG